MKQLITKSIKLLSINIFILFMNNCSDSNTLIMNEEESKAVISSTRSTIAQNIPFVWDDSNNPKINIGGSEIILPFYNGSPGVGLPQNIVNDYKKIDGWEMVYNFITDPNLYVEGRNIFILYYNTITPTIGKTTFIKISIDDANTKLFNCANLGIYYLPLNQTGPQSVYTSNIINIDAKSLCLGWNCFDIEMSYDDSYKTNPTKSAEISIGFYDQLVWHILLNGYYDTSGNLSYVETSSSNPMGDLMQSIFNAVGVKSGEAAENAILSQRSDTSSVSTRSATLTSILGTVVKTGISNLISSVTKSWTSIFAKQTNTYKTMDIKMSSKIKIDGTITSSLPSIGIGVFNLPVPGSKLDADATLSPIYHAPLGVWNLKSLKTVKIGDHIFPTIEDIEGGYPTSDDSYPFYANVGEYIEIVPPQYRKEDVIINDSVLSCISNYEVKSEIFYKKRNNDEKAINDSIITNDNKIWIRNYSNKYYPYKDKHYISKAYWMYLNSDSYERRLTSDVYFDSDYLKFIAKVTLLLYPKAPYNTDVISLTRTYECKTEKVSTPFLGRALIGSYN